MSDESPARWQSRVIGEGVVEAGQLLANPRNWRIHPREQQRAMREVLDQIGWVQAVIVNQRTGTVVDGHLRVMLALRQGDDTPVPVRYVDLSEAEERAVLATFDQVTLMAGYDEGRIDAILDRLGKTMPGLATTLERLWPYQERDTIPDWDAQATGPAQLPEVYFLFFRGDQWERLGLMSDPDPAARITEACRRYLEDQ